MQIHMPEYLKRSRVKFFHELRIGANQRDILAAWSWGDRSTLPPGADGISLLQVESPCSPNVTAAISFKGLPTEEELLNGYDMSANYHNLEFGEGKCPCASCVRATLSQLGEEEGWEQLRTARNKKLPKSKKLPPWEQLHPQARVLLHDQAMKLIGLLQVRDRMMDQCRRLAAQSFLWYTKPGNNSSSRCDPPSWLSTDPSIFNASPQAEQLHTLLEMEAGATHPEACRLLRTMMPAVMGPTATDGVPMTALQIM